MRATGERFIFREKNNACAFGFVFMLLCSVWFCVDFFIMVSLFVALVVFVFCLFD